MLRVCDALDRLGCVRNRPRQSAVFLRDWPTAGTRRLLGSAVVTGQIVVACPTRERGHPGPLHALTDRQAGKERPSRSRKKPGAAGHAAPDDSQELGHFRWLAETPLPIRRHSIDQIEVVKQVWRIAVLQRLPPHQRFVETTTEVLVVDADRVGIRALKVGCLVFGAKA